MVVVGGWVRACVKLRTCVRACVWCVCGGGAYDMFGMELRWGQTLM